VFLWGFEKMRSVFTLLALLVALALVALLARQQFAALRGPSPAAQSVPAQPGAAAQTPRQMEQQVQELTQPRPMPEDAR
jgi:predicted lipid-binding transport protein (Tim44 family)